MMIGQDQDRVQVGVLAIDPWTRTVHVDGGVVRLTDAEWRLLTVLARDPGRPVAWRTLLELVWEAPHWSGGHNLVKVAIHRLRQRLGDDMTAPRYVETVRGAGYRLRV